jgi:hypothetical protein
MKCFRCLTSMYTFHPASDRLVYFCSQCAIRIVKVTTLSHRIIWCIVENEDNSTTRSASLYLDKDQEQIPTRLQPLQKQQRVIMQGNEKYCTGVCGRLLPATKEYFDRSHQHGLQSQCKECLKEKRKAYRQRQEIQEREQAYYKAYNETYLQQPEVQERMKKYSQERREQRKAYWQNYSKRPDVRERRQAYHRAYYQQRREANAIRP